MKWLLIAMLLCPLASASFYTELNMRSEPLRDGDGCGGTTYGMTEEDGGQVTHYFDLASDCYIEFETELLGAEVQGAGTNLYVRCNLFVEIFEPTLVTRVVQNDTVVFEAREDITSNCTKAEGELVMAFWNLTVPSGLVQLQFSVDAPQAPEGTLSTWQLGIGVAGFKVGTFGYYYSYKPSWTLPNGATYMDIDRSISRSTFTKEEQWDNVLFGVHPGDTAFGNIRLENGTVTLQIYDENGSKLESSQFSESCTNFELPSGLRYLHFVQDQVEGTFSWSVHEKNVSCEAAPPTSTIPPGNYTYDPETETYTRLPDEPIRDEKNASAPFLAVGILAAAMASRKWA